MRRRKKLMTFEEVLILLWTTMGKKSFQSLPFFDSSSEKVAEGSRKFSIWVATASQTGNLFRPPRISKWNLFFYLSEKKLQKVLKWKFHCVKSEAPQERRKWNFFIFRFTHNEFSLLLANLILRRSEQEEISFFLSAYFNLERIEFLLNRTWSGRISLFM